MAAGFNEQFDRHGAWRREMGMRLKVLADWLREQELLDDGSEESVQRLAEQLRADKVMVAFVAEFSRGKSELINAVFFAGYGRRIMPASAGRTTMCPTELGYDAGLPPCLRLLPIETRLQPQALLDWRQVPEKWTRVDLDVNDPAQLAGAMEKVSEVLHVSQDEARALGFWHDDRPDDNPPVDAAGAVEVPRWRHALINMAHPLLKQGLVVLDTPGLNAIGAEPELTVNLIPQAQAVVFILGADTGVTKSDLTIWREHLASVDDGLGTRFVVLNKIDTLWDELSTPARIEAQIARQCAETAHTLELPPAQVIALSAQKGLLAKVRGDDGLLAQSRLPPFEQLLGRQVLGARQSVLQGAIRASVGRLQADAARTLGARRRELAEQALELKGLRGKNHVVIRQMRLRVEQEKAEFDRSAASVLAVRTVHMKLLREVFKLLGSSSIKKELAGLATMLRESGVKFGVKRAYAHGFDNLRGVMRRVQMLEGEIHEMLTNAFRQLNAEYGFSLQAAPPPDMARFESDLGAVERSHLQYLGVGNIVQLARPEFAEKLLRALVARVRSIFETALGDIELWNKSCSSQLDAQLRERRRAFGRRIEAIQRIQGAAGELDGRIAEIGEQEAALEAAQRRLSGLAHELQTSDLDAPAPHPQPEAATA
ncbi:MAG: dynamin family protein [Ottowia sp.]|uniref:dynamin family protein n=1 Tax=Ottowia sp. TaxID=1898956 RepID=UPI0039E482F2